MGSGFLMKAAALRVMSRLTGDEQKEALEGSGIDFLIDVFGNDEIGDYITSCKRAAELVAKALKADFLATGWGQDDCSADVVPVEKHGRTFYKVSFFK